MVKEVWDKKKNEGKKFQDEIFFVQKALWWREKKDYLNVWWKLKHLNFDKSQKPKVFYEHIYNFLIYSYSFILTIASKPLKLGRCTLERMFTPTKCYI